MYKVFISEPIGVKNAFNYKLKTIGKEMYKLKLINVEWINNGIQDGLDAMITVLDYYRDKSKYHYLIKNIIDYNEIDCKIIWAIVGYLRNNNV